MDVNLPRDKETGKPRGFAFLMYEDQRSTVLAVDNLNGAKVLERTLRVDHVKDYKQKGTKGARYGGDRQQYCGTTGQRCVDRGGGPPPPSEG